MDGGSLDIELLLRRVEEDKTGFSENFLDFLEIAGSFQKQAPGLENK